MQVWDEISDVILTRDDEDIETPSLFKALFLFRIPYDVVQYMLAIKLKEEIVITIIDWEVNRV